MLNIQNKLLRKFVELNEQTESPELFLIWSLLGIASACAAREVNFKLGDTIIYPNQIILLVGNSGVRKSTVINTVSKLIPEYVAIAPNEIEAGSVGLIQYMAGITDQQIAKMQRKSSKFNKVPSLDELDFSSIDCVAPTATVREKNPSTPLILNSEFSTFVGNGSFKLMTTLSHLWDGNDYNRQGIIIKEPLINVLSAITPSTLAKILPPEQVEQGFVSRCIFVYGSKTKQIPRPRFFTPDKMPELIEAYKNIEFTYQKTTLDETPDAAEYLDNLYLLNKQVRDFRFTYYNSRRHIHLIKTAMAIAILCNSKVITREMYEDADLILSATEELMPEALGEYGLSKLSEAKQKLLDYIRQSDTQISYQELSRLASKDMRDSDFSSILQGFVNEGKVITWINDVNNMRYYATAKSSLAGKLVKSN